MASKTKAAKSSSKKVQKSAISSNGRTPAGSSSANASVPAMPAVRVNQYGIPDWRLEQPEFEIIEVASGPEVHYEIRGKLDSAVPPIRESKYLSKEQSVELYRWMIMNRRMEIALENLYKQSKVVGGVYFGLGQEACSCASAYALGPDDWFAPMIRNQGALLVRGWRARDVMMQYMAKAGSPTKGKDANTHFGDIMERNQVSPISMLGDLVPILTGVALGARLQGRNIACLTWVGDGGQSAGVTYEGFNFAAVQKLGLVLIVESNLWAYSTPTEMQVAVKDLATRAIGYGVPGVIVDGTDPCQVYDATHEACERARRGEGPTLLEMRTYRLRGHVEAEKTFLSKAYRSDEEVEARRAAEPLARCRALLAAAGVLLVLVAVAVSVLRLPEPFLTAAVVLSVLLLVLGGLTVTRSSTLVRLGEEGYQVRLLRGAGVRRARWRDVEDAVTATVSGHDCVVLRLRDGRTTTIPVQVLAGDREEFARDVRAHLQRSPGGPAPGRT